MSAFDLTPQAAHDVDAIWEFLALQSIEVADGILDDLVEAMEAIARNPGIGHWREELVDKRHKLYLVHSYFLVYRHETKPIQIVRVLHAARDMRAVFSS